MLSGSVSVWGIGYQIDKSITKVRRTRARRHLNADNPGAGAETSSKLASVDIMNGSASPILSPISSRFPAATGRGQAYYWSYIWQLGEQKVDEELVSGLGKTFDNAQDAIQWLLSSDQ